MYSNIKNNFTINNICFAYIFILLIDHIFSKYREHNIAIDVRTMNFNILRNNNKTIVIVFNRYNFKLYVFFFYQTINGIRNHVEHFHEKLITY